MRAVLLVVFLSLACFGCAGGEDDGRPLKPDTAPDTSELDDAMKEYAGELEKRKQSKK